MGSLKQPHPVKLIIAFIFKDERAFEKARFILEKRFGKSDFLSLTLPFNHTDYYRKEFGKDLKRKFISFQKLIPPELLSKIKNTTNKIERDLSDKGSRLINIDCGYLDLGKLVLATSKDHQHRIYLGKGIYAEVTLFYQDKTFKAWEWTYPDYRTQDYIAILKQIREIYAKQLKKVKIR